MSRSGLNFYFQSGAPNLIAATVKAVRVRVDVPLKQTSDVCCVGIEFWNQTEVAALVENCTEVSVNAGKTA